jgi:myo-inositol-1(or 4)-monophosphatase
MPWDFAAGIVIVREAGGVVSGQDGLDLAMAPGHVRAANSLALLQELMSAVAG